MSTLTTVLAIFVALEHLYIIFLETIATDSESTSRVFGISIDLLKNKTISTLLKNQGVYNGLIAVLLLVAVWQQDLLWTRLLLGYVEREHFGRKSKENEIKKITMARKSIGAKL